MKENNKNQLKTVTLLVDNEFCEEIDKIRKNEKATKAWTYRKVMGLGIDSYWKHQEILEKAEKKNKNDGNNKLDKLTQENKKEILMKEIKNTEDISKKLEEGIIRQVKQLTEINSRFGNVEVKKIYGSEKEKDN